MLQSRNGNLELLLLARQTNSRENLRVGDEHGREKLLQIITLRGCAQGARLALDLVHIPVRNILQKLLEHQKDLIRICLLLLCIIQHIKKVLLESRQ